MSVFACALRMKAEVSGLNISSPLSADFRLELWHCYLCGTSSVLPKLNMFTLLQPRGRTPTVTGGLLGALAVRSPPAVLRSYAATRCLQAGTIQVCAA